MTQAIASVVIFVLAITQGESFPTLSSFMSWPVVIGLAIGVFMNVISPLVTIWAFKYLDEVFASQLFLSENIFALIVGYLFYGEMVGFVSLLGAGVVVSSVYVMNKLQTT